MLIDLSSFLDDVGSVSKPIETVIIIFGRDFKIDFQRSNYVN
jgi:hypothetical protein